LQARRITSRILGAIMLALAPLALLGGLGTHTGHAAGQAKAPIFADARHAAEASHWEAVHTVRTNRCPVCLAPGQPLETAPVNITDQLCAGAGSVGTSNTESPPDTGAGRSQRPRGPPSS
jgi:hypothetical protein